MLLKLLFIYALTVQPLTCTENNNKNIRPCLQQCRESTKTIPKFRDCINGECFNKNEEENGPGMMNVTTELIPTMPAAARTMTDGSMVTQEIRTDSEVARMNQCLFTKVPRTFIVDIGGESFEVIYDEIVSVCS